MRGEKGFTLIELLVVVAIIGILVAIAIPQFAAYKKNANDSAAQTDVRNAALAAEAYYAGNNAYPGGPGGTATLTAATVLSPCPDAGTTTTGGLCTSGFSKVSTGNTVVYLTAAAPGTTYTITGSNIGGTGKTFTWDSSKGGMQ
ncbi:MAG: type II secretion system protein [Nitrospinae bacterium]|nr:type II secretion system protein [Nitrospinota bacterium]